MDRPKLLAIALMVAVWTLALLVEGGALERNPVPNPVEQRLSER